MIQKHCGAMGLDYGTYDMHLFLLGHSTYLQRDVGTNFAKAATVSSLNSCWVLAQPVGASLDTKQELMEVVGHEIGHIFFGSGHPDDPLPFLVDSGVAPLRGTDPTRRLMYSSVGPDTRRIVKKEWDKAEEWLKTRRRGDQ